MIRYHAAWILSITDRPIRDGWVLTHDGRVVATGADTAVADADDVVDLGAVAVLPGLVNAHTHLELSYLRGQVPPGGHFVDWIRGVMAARRQRPDPESSEIIDGIDRGIGEALAAGTAVVGDISNTLVTIPRLNASPLAGIVFNELIRFNEQDPDGLVARARAAIDARPLNDHVRASLAAHAPYSVGRSLLQAIKSACDGLPCAVHLSESSEEVEFIAHSTGPWRTLLEEIGVWDQSWVAPNTSPVGYLDALGFLDAHVVAAHGVQMTAPDLAVLAARGTTLVTCPRSNRHTGAGTPPVEAFYAAGVRVAIGTDSLASSPDLNVFSEISELRRLAPRVPAAALLDSATRQGARALGFDADYGTLDPGKRARVIAITVPGVVDDVEEYLVSGIGPDQIRWVE